MTIKIIKTNSDKIAIVNSEEPILNDEIKALRIAVALINKELGEQG